MVLLRSLPEFSTMCISAIDFLGDAINCKGSSMFGTIDCNDSSWCDSRDEVVESNSLGARNHEEDLSGRYSDQLDTRSLSSSVYLLFHDSSQRLDHRATATLKSAGSEIFRHRRFSSETSIDISRFSELNRCRAWVQDDLSFESDYPKDLSSKMKSVRIVHWEDRLSDSENLDEKNIHGIFRLTNATLKTNNDFVGSYKLDRCTAWSLDDSSSLRFDDSVSSVRRRGSLLRRNTADRVYWDQLIQGKIQ